MAKNKIEDGQTIDFTAATAHKSGDLIEVGALAVVVHQNVEAGEPGVGHVEGVWSLPKSTAIAIAQGEAVYIKNAVISKDNTGVYAGKAWESKDAADEEISVRINF
ncbi:DUF2190 family protein [Vibrio parahaemolyticus]|uniref:DUF2190 family protein n=1 Tax=Vibrio parahaemolyticus TaxID=670 RepID=UPI00100E120B|nr:capsid cement protein [Vibrio parahaemolyticus]MCZ5870226.1 DUF2190 family protein [Vibrio parahaemolyticus]MCZ5900542.1 DUF2190 family protein [Vibrio parahaemolyticus]MCZ6308866.1 DUF2190 family protein [Vibrio parahaemolyticus]RXP53085.1 DUF2190 family protein [Vibrio parahaemolyticus]RXP65343.1 DUF2190 family protein [Vibrio parahaemolyticus]